MPVRPGGGASLHRQLPGGRQRRFCQHIDAVGELRRRSEYEFVLPRLDAERRESPMGYGDRRGWNPSSEVAASVTWTQNAMGAERQSLSKVKRKVWVVTMEKGRVTRKVRLWPTVACRRAAAPCPCRSLLVTSSSFYVRTRHAHLAKAQIGCPPNKSWPPMSRKL